MNKKIIAILFGIVLVGAFLRFYSLGETKLGFFRDEAALGFNAWSILKTGADEYGQTLPVIFRSFEVFFLPAYVYLSVPIFLILGPTFIAARALSAISGMLVILSCFFIAKEFFKSGKIALISAFLVAITPWAIFYSRGAFEGNLALLAFSLGIYLWLKYRSTDKIQFFFLSVAFFIASMYSYQAPRLVAPLFIAVSIFTQKHWLRKWKLWFMGLIFALVLYLPVLVLTASPAGYHRAVEVSILSSRESPPGYSDKVGAWQKLYLVPRQLISLYLHYFSPNNLFLQNDYNPQRTVEGFSVFYIWQLPLLLIGVWKFLKISLKNSKDLLFWIILAPIPAALTADPFHTYRAILLFLPLTILTALGLWHILSLGKKIRYITAVSFLLLILYSLSSYFFSLLKLTPIVRWRDWDYGYQQVSEFVKSQPSYLRVVVDDPNTQGYIHFLFNQVVPISEYQRQARLSIAGKYYSSTIDLRPQKVGRFEFRHVDWPTERGNANTLFIFPSNRLYPSEFSGDPKLKLEKTVFSPSGDAAFYIIRVF